MATDEYTTPPPSPDIVTKQCSLCKVYKPYTDFYVRKARNNRPTSRCKLCERLCSGAWAQAQRKKAPDKAKANDRLRFCKRRAVADELRAKYIDIPKHCPRCGIVQARTVFHPVNGTYDGYQTICKKCNKEKSNGFYAVNCEEQKAKRKITYAEDPEKQKQANQAWRKEHPEEVREQSHRASVKRRALLMHCPLIEDFSRKDVFIRDKWICQLCYKPVKKTLRFPHPKSPSLDHVIPVMQGGNHSYQNCVLTHLGCNAAKAARDVQQQQRLF